MKNYFLKTLALIIILSSCQNSDEVKILPSGKIIFTENPIWINQDCETKTIKFRLDHLQKDSIEIKLDDEIVEVNFNESKNPFNSLFGEVIIPTDIGYKSISFTNRNDKSVLAKEEIIYVQKEDTLNFYSHNYHFIKPMIGKQVQCWTDYNGDIIPGRFDYEVSSEVKKSTERIGENVKRTLELNNVYLIEKESKEKYFISPKIVQSTTIKNYGNLGNSIVTTNAYGKYEIGLDVKNKNQLEAAQSDVILNNKTDNFPSFRVIEEIYGHQITGVLKSCNEIDTLKIEAFVLPERIQVELNCKQKSNS